MTRECQSLSSRRSISIDSLVRVDSPQIIPDPGLVTGPSRVRVALACLTLASCLPLAACDRDAPQARDPFLEALAQPVAPTSPASTPSPPPLPPPPDFEPERRFSPDLYADFASRVIPYAKLARDAGGAFRRIELQALELDFFEDDWIEREGGLVLLGTERGRVVALTTRYYADITYPDPRVIADGWGGSEIGGQYLEIRASGGRCAPGSDCPSPRFRLRPFGRKQREQPSFGDEPVLEYKVFDDHDVALLYFPRNDSPFAASDTLGIPEPTRAIERKLREASHLYGFEMSLVSKESLAELRSHIEVKSAAGSLLKMAVALAAGPIIGAIAGPVSGLSEKLTDKATDIVTDVGAEALAGVAVPLGDEWERGGQGLDEVPAPDRLQPRPPATMPTVVTDAELDVGHDGVAILAASGRQPSIRLLGVRIEADGRTDCAKWVSRALRKGQVIVSSDRWGDTRAGSLVMLPDDRIVLNVELLRHGFARLDLEHPEVLRSFPLLVDAAWEALEARTGLARDWHEDQEYVAAVAALR